MVRGHADHNLKILRFDNTNNLWVKASILFQKKLRVALLPFAQYEATRHDSYYILRLHHKTQQVYVLIFEDNAINVLAS